jgi:hypothetical protein
MKRLLPLLFISTVTPSVTMAAELDLIGALNQDQFRDLSEDFGSALSYKATSPVEALGITGFDIGFEATSTKMANVDSWEAASSDDVETTLIVPKVHIHKGLPFGLDVGVFYSSVPDTDIKLTGAELRYALVDGGVATPAIGLRLTYSKLSGVENLEFSTQGVEVGISKGFAFFTPYAGVGRVSVTSDPVDTGLDEEEFSQSKSFVGANFNFGLMNFGIEGDKTGDATTYAAKFGWRF